MSEKIERQGLTWRHVGVVATMMLTLLTAVGIVFIAAGLCYRPVAQHFNCQVSDVSFYITCVYIGSAVGPIPAGRLFDKFSPRVLFTICAVMVAVPYFFLAYYPAIWMFYIAGFIIGLGLCALEYTMTAGILSRWFHTNYGTVIGISFAMTGLGGIIWNFIGQFILGVDLSGWPILYQAYGICIAVGTIIPILLFVHRTPEEVGTLPYGMPLNAEAAADDGDIVAPEKRGYTFSETMRMPLFWTFIIGSGLMNCCTTLCQMFATYVQFLGNDGWEGQAIVALLLLSGTLESFASFGQMGGKVIVGWLESRNLVAAQVLGVTGGIIGLMMIWWCPRMMGEGGIWPMFFGGMFYGLMYACSTAMMPFMVREVFGEKDYDRIYSIEVAFYNLIGGFGATLWAVIMQNWGWDAFFVAALADVIITFILLCSVAVLGYKKREKTWYVSDAELAHTA